MKFFHVIVITALAALAACEKPPAAPSTPAEKAEALLKQMTLAEKIGQMTQVDSDALRGREQDIAKYFLGSILSGGNSNPQSGNTAEDWKNLVTSLDAYAGQTRLRIPIVYGIDAVHGNNNVVSATIFPHNIGLGATRDPRLVEAGSRVTAKETAGIAADWAFAPCVAVARNIRWGRTYESYSEDPALVAELGAAAVRGLQGSDRTANDAILSCTKHFLGDGATLNGKDQGDAQTDLETLKKIHLPGYVAAIEAGTDSIMISYSSWNGLKMHAQRELIAGLLKGEMGFKGFVVSDWAAIDQINKEDYKDCVEKSINAGIDMVMIPHASPDPLPHEPADKRHNTFYQFIDYLTELVNEGKVPMERIDDAVRRILTVKYQYGLFDARKGSPELFAAIGSPEHREIARDSVRKSLVLLQNRNNVLPLSKSAKRIGITGRGANNLEMQCGGWTLDWQTMNGGSLVGATSVLDALSAAVSEDTEIVVSPDGSGLEGCDVVLAVIGENSYAEYSGDREDLSLEAGDLETVANAAKSGAPVVTVLFSGRPMLIASVLEQSDGVIAAWLPGSEGAGITDVLFGDAKPTGKLSFTWPRTMEQVPTDGATDPQFPFGFGLTYD